MKTLSNELRNQIEEAFRYRGHVTLSLRKGEKIEGYLFNREFENQKTPDDMFVELFLKGSGDRKKLKIDEIESVRLTGEDHADGKSYQDWIKKEEAKKNIQLG